MLNHHLGGLLGLGSLAWAGHQIHVSLPINKLLDAGVDPKEIPLPHEFFLNKQLMIDLYPSFAKGLTPFFTLQWSEYSDFLTFKGGLNEVTGGLNLSDTAHHHLAIAVLFLIAGHMYRTNWGIGHSIKEILDYYTFSLFWKKSQSINLFKKRIFLVIHVFWLNIYHLTTNKNNSLPTCKKNLQRKKGVRFGAGLPFACKKSQNFVSATSSSFQLRNLEPEGTLSGSPSLPFNFNFFFLPGVYVIINTKINKYYFGESKNVADRLSGHYTTLIAGTHDCKELQNDWNLYGEDVFAFNILELGVNPWSDPVERRKAERQYIQQHQGHVYNQMSVGEIKQPLNDNVQTHNSIPVIVYGREFTSVSAAARENNTSLSSASYHLNNPDNLSDKNYVDMNRRAVTNVAKPVFIGPLFENNILTGRLFASVALAAANLRINDKTLRKYIREKPDWNYFYSLPIEEQQEIKKFLFLAN
jgi:group I intron endonuclease